MVIIASSVLGGSLCGQRAVLPFGADGNGRRGSSALPWGIASESIVVQDGYDRDHWLDQGSIQPILIERLRWRANCFATAPGGVFQAVTVSLSTMDIDHEAMTPSFATNRGSDHRLVYQGSVAVAPAQGSDPNNFIVDIVLTTPFLYDPLVADLLVEVEILAGSWSGELAANIDHDTVPATARGTRVRALNNGSAAVQPDRAPVLEISHRPATGLFAHFDATPRFGDSPLSVQFIDQSYSSASGGIQSWEWDFDADGVIDSTVQNPVHVFGPGEHTITLRLNDGQFASQTETRECFIITDPIEADFEATRAAAVGASVPFRDASTVGVASWAWDFDGDGGIDSTLQNPIHVYTAPGRYDVSLTVGLRCQTATKGVRQFIYVGAAVDPGPADVVQFQFNEVRGTRVGNSAVHTFPAASGGDVSNAKWQADPGRPGFGANQSGVGVLGVSATPNSNLITTDWSPNVLTDLTISFWIRNHSPHQGAAYVLGDQIGRFGCWIDGRFDFFGYKGDGRLAYSTSGLGIQRLGEWQHCCVVIDDGPNVAVWYLNGASAGGRFFPRPTLSASDVRIGWGTDPAERLTAHYDLDDLRVYGRALSRDEVLGLSLSTEAASVGFFGTGCVGNFGVPRISARGLPTLGNASFAIRLQFAEPNKPAALVLGVDPNAPSLPRDLSQILGPGCLLEVDPLSTVLTSTMNGAVDYPLPIPGDRSLVGQHLYGQWLIAGQPTGSRGAASEAMDLRLK